MKIKHFIGGYDNNLSYLLWCPNSRHAAIIDPAVEINPIIEFIEKEDLILDKILITHSHHDHMKYVDDFIHHFNLIKIYISYQSAKKFKFLPITNNQIINIGTKILVCLETPGHYYDSFCFWDSKNKLIFTGDTMFIGRTGRTISPKSNIKDLYNSVYKILLKLPNQTMIYPGHHYGYRMFDTIKNNIESSDFFCCKNFDVFCLIMNKYEENRKK